MILVGLIGCLSEPGALVPPTVDEDPALPGVDIEVAGQTRRVHLQTFGDPSDPTVLFLHGSLADHRSFLPFAVLDDRYHLVMWDRRGMGLSERIEADEYTWDTVVDEIDAIKQRYSPDEPVALVGHSFGAMFAALYLSARPGEVDKAVLMEPAGLTGDRFAAHGSTIEIDLLGAGLNEAFWQSEVLSPRGHEVIDYKALRLLLDGRQTSYHCDPDHPVPFPVWRPGAFLEVWRGRRMGIAGSGAALTADYDFAYGLDAVDFPVLLIAGRCSTVIGPEAQRALHLPLFPDAELVVVEDAGHRMFVDDFDATLAAVEAYLARP